MNIRELIQVLVTYDLDLPVEYGMSGVSGPVERNELRLEYSADGKPLLFIGEAD